MDDECKKSPNGHHQVDCPVGELILHCQFCGKNLGVNKYLG